MFCFQCEQTGKGTGCTRAGVCGKDGQTTALQDLLVYATKGIAMYAHRARALEARDSTVDRFIPEALFTTVTNVNFDPPSIRAILDLALEIRGKARKLYEDACRREARKPEALTGPATWTPASDLDGLMKQAADIGLSLIHI